MPDYWSVPLATNTIDDLDSTIAKGPDLSWMGSLPDSYFKGLDAAYTQRNRDVFQNGLPKDANGTVDWSQVSQNLAKAGGSGATQNVIGLQNLQIARNALSSLGSVFGQSPGAPPSSGAAIPNAVPTTNLSAPAQTPVSPATQPTIPSDIAGKASPPGQNLTDNTILGVQAGPVETGSQVTALTARNLAYRTGGDMNQIAAALGVSPDEVLNPNDPNVRQKIAQIVRPQTTGQPVQTAAAPVQTAQAQTQQVQQPVQTTQGNINEATAANYEGRAQRAYQAATALSFSNPPAGARLQAMGDQLMQQAKVIRGALANNAQLTPEQKNAQSSGSASPLNYQGQVELNKQDVTNFNKEYTSLQSLGRASYNGVQKAQLMKNLTLQPTFYSGPFNELSQSYNQFKSIFGTNPSSALPQEAFNKTVNDALQEQVRSMGQSGVGRVLQSEVNIMRNSIASLGITPASNRALAEILSRVYKQSQDIAQLSQNIPQQPGSMTKTLNARIDDYLQQHPLYSEQEKQNPALLGAPDAPPQSTQWSPAQARQWAMGVGLKPGDPIRMNGKIVAVP